MKKFNLINGIVIFNLLFASSAMGQFKNEPSVGFNEKSMHPPPVPYFIITGLCFGDTTHFINKMASAVLHTQWDVVTDKGDTIFTSQSQDASYYFKKRGVYNVCLFADNGHIASKIRTVRVDTITKADFNFHYCYDEFENTSSCAEQFVWVLPDNSMSTDFSPLYKFTATGNYPVKLIAKKGNKADTLYKIIHVSGDSMGLPNATFTCKRIDTSSTFEFTAVDSLADKYSWYFGDDQSDDTSGYKVVHHINKNKYKPPVNLFVSNACGFSVEVLDPFEAMAIQEKFFLKTNTLIYPNPVANELNIQLSNLISGQFLFIRLIDGNGKTVDEQQTVTSGAVQTLTLDSRHLSSGIYMVQILLNGQLLNKKIIVE